MNDPNTSSSGRLVWGVLLITAGLFFLAVNFLDITLENVWPVALLVPSLAFYVMVIRDRRQFGLLMPATVLLVMSVLFFVCQANGWEMMGHLWPLFMFAPGLAFFLMYLVGKQDRALLVPGTVLTGLSVIFLLMINGYGRLWPALLIVVGIAVLLRHRSNNAAPPAPEPPPVDSTTISTPTDR